MAELYSWPEILTAVLDRRDLSVSESTWAMRQVMRGDATPSQLAGFLLALRAKGEKLFNSGDAARNIIACAVCHGGNGRGLDAHGIASVTNLAPKYAGTVLYEFRDTPSFGGLTHPEAMRIALKPLNDRDLKDVAAYLSSMRP